MKCIVLLSLIALSASEELKDSEPIASTKLGIWPAGWVGEYDVRNNQGYGSRNDGDRYSDVRNNEGYGSRNDGDRYSNDCDDKNGYGCGNYNGRTQKEYEEQREIYGGQGYERIFNDDKDDYRWRVIGRQGLGFQKRFERASGLRHPITPKALSFVGYRPYYESLYNDYN